MDKQKFKKNVTSTVKNKPTDKKENKKTIFTLLKVDCPTDIGWQV